MIYDIWDIDNCVANDEWRIKFIDWTPGLNPDERYTGYHQRCGMDAPGNEHTFASRGLVAPPVFFTARPQWTEEVTRHWLRRELNVVDRATIYFRQEREFIPSVQLKEKMLGALLHTLGPGDGIGSAFDDREDIVEMYRRHGIDAHVLKIHDACAYTNPLTREKPHGV